jgi:hypothetical protein
MGEHRMVMRLELKSVATGRELGLVIGPIASWP